LSIVLHEQPTAVSSWQVPKFESTPEDRFGYIQEAIQEGEGYLSGQRSYKNLPDNMKLFDSIFNDKTISTLVSNFLRYNIRKFVETISDIREIGTFGSDAPQYRDYAEVTNKVAKAIYIESQFPRQLRKTLQYASVMGVGYLWPKCKTEDYGFGERRIIFEPLGLLDVLPVQVPATNDVQDAYLVTIYEYMPIAEAHARFPLFQADLMPIDRVVHPSRLSAKRLDWAEKFRYGGETRNWGNLYCEIRYTFIRDLRINNLGLELPMGDEDTSWFYKVPYIGQDIFGGIRNGQPFMRPAKAEDCRVYPNLRLMITTPGIDRPMYDGPAWDWHGKMPTVQYTVDDWPWEGLGMSLIDSVGTVERTKRKHERQMDQVLTTKKNPPMGYDRTATGGPKIENFDIFAQNIRAGVDGEPKKILQSLLPEEVRVEEVDFKFVEYLKQMEEGQLGINDLGNLVNMKMNVASDSFDKALEAVGPIAKGIAATMEAGNAKVANMLKFMIPQWMTTRRIIEYIGPDKITPEMLDFDPDSMIPSHMEDELVNVGGAMLKPYDELPDGNRIPKGSAYDKLTRARVFTRNLRLISVPSTLLKITALQKQTMIMALFGRGFPLPPDYVAEKLEIENWGTLPGTTLLERWVNWMKLELGLKAEAAQLASKLGLDGPGQPTGKQHAGGRPAKNAGGKPVMKDKKDNPRPVMKTT
jgi:hypothetical protein